MASMDTHYKMSIYLMKILGIWPYVNKNIRRVQTTIVNLISAFFVAAQIAYIVKGVDLLMLLNCMCFILITLGSVVKFNTFLVQTGATRNLMEDVKKTWNTTDEDTLGILEKRAILGRKLGFIYGLFLYPSAFLQVLLRVASYVMVVTAPLGSNVTDTYPVPMDYVIDEDKYFFFIMIHQILTILFGTTAFVATECIYYMWIEHCISLFELASYHIEKGISDRPVSMSKDLTENDRKKCLVTAVNYHNEGKVFLTYQKEKFKVSYGAIILISIISLAINFFRLSNAFSVTHDMEEAVQSIFLCVSELAYMFYLNYVMQGVVDYTEDLPNIVYSTPWYNRSYMIKKKLLVILMSCSKPISFDFYGFYTASTEGFGAMVKMTVSYFLMMSSLN